MSVLDTFRTAIFGNPPSVAFKPSREGMVKGFEELINQLNSLTIGVESYATTDLLPTGPNLPPNGTQARVYDDPTDTDNTFWIVQSGGWVKDVDFVNVLINVIEPQVEEIDAQVLLAQQAVVDANSAVTNAQNVVSSVIRSNLLKIENGINASRTMLYTSTAGRTSLTSTGFAFCPVNIERLCYDVNGRQIGTALQAGDTFRSARWHDPAATHTNVDFEYLVPTSGNGSVAYAGQHARRSPFADNVYANGGFIITQGSTAGSNTQRWNALNVSATTAINDLVRVHAMVSIVPGSAGPGVFVLHMRGANNNAFLFNYDATGQITGFTENWAGFRSGFTDIGVLNGNRWAMVWFDCLATAAGATTPAIGFSTTDPNQIIHVAELMIQVNPRSAPSIYPVCAPNKVFIADTIDTGIRQQVGYVMPNIAVARSQAPNGRITVPEIPIGISPWAMEQEIQIYQSTEDADRAGIMHNSNDYYAFTPWRNPVEHVVGVGPSSFPNKITMELNKGATTYRIVPVFKNRPELQPVIRSIETNVTRLTNLYADDIVLLAQFDNTTSNWQQTDIRSGSTAQQYLGAASNVYARRVLMMGVPPSHSRAYWQTQEDEDEYNRAYIGEFKLTITTGTVDCSGSRCTHLARGPFPGSGNVTQPINFFCNDFMISEFWSDGCYPTAGLFTTQMNRFYIGRSTSQDQMFWQSQKEIEVDLLDGLGWRNFSTTGLTQNQLPQGRRASHFGSYDFVTGVLTENPDPTLSMMLRRFSYSAGSVADRPGFQFHADQVENETKDYGRYPALGSVWVVSSPTMRVRVYIQGGFYNASTGVWTVTTSGDPALIASGTHTDSIQYNTSGIHSESHVSQFGFIMATTQGPYIYGTSVARVGNITFEDLIMCTSEINGSLLGGVNNPNPAVINLRRVLLVQRQSKFRLNSGQAEATRFNFNGNLTTVNLEDVWAVTSNPTGMTLSGTPTINGAVNRIPAPLISAYDTITPPASNPSSLNVIPANLRDKKYGVVIADTEPRDFEVMAYAEQKTNIRVNYIVQLCIGNHPRWDALIREFYNIYHKTPEFVKRDVYNDLAVGTVISLDGKIKASNFHLTHGNHRGGFFTLNGTGGLVVSKALTGMNTMWLLRTSLDEILLLDIIPRP